MEEGRDQKGNGRFSVVEWHPYPEERPDPKRPQWSNFYLTTERHMDGSRETTITKWDPKKKRFRTVMGDESYIEAWAELPNAYVQQQDTATTGRKEK